MLFSVKEINGKDLVYRESHFKWGKIDHCLNKNSHPPLSSLSLESHEVEVRRSVLCWKVREF